MTARTDGFFVTVDSLRADAAAIPTLDRLHDDALEYPVAFAQRLYTTFSVPSLFSPCYPSGLKYVDISDSTAGVAVPDGMEGEPLPTDEDGGDESDADEHREPRVIAETDVVPHYHACVRTRRWKYVRDGDEERLYDIANDPDETESVAEPDVREQLAGALDEHLARSAIRNAADGERVDIDDAAVQDRLADLGYLE